MVEEQSKSSIKGEVEQMSAEMQEAYETCQCFLKKLTNGQSFFWVILSRNWAHTCQLSRKNEQNIDRGWSQCGCSYIIFISFLFSRSKFEREQYSLPLASLIDFRLEPKEIDYDTGQF